MIAQNLYSPSVAIIFPKVQKSFPSVLSKEFYPISLQVHNKSAHRKHLKHKRTSRGKISKQGSTIVSRSIKLEAKKEYSGDRKKAYSS